ncbi:MAG: glutaredoxin family protein [Candidatus Aenigmatarchaeota archaeon]
MIVNVYSTNTCPYCKMIMDFLRENDVEFEEINVQVNRKAAKEIVERTGQMKVPVTEINEKLIVGYNLDAIKEELGLAKSSENKNL